MNSKSLILKHLNVFVQDDSTPPWTDASPVDMIVSVAKIEMPVLPVIMISDRQKEHWLMEIVFVLLLVTMMIEIDRISFVRSVMILVELVMDLTLMIVWVVKMINNWIISVIVFVEMVYLWFNLANAYAYLQLYSSMENVWMLMFNVMKIKHNKYKVWVQNVLVRMVL